MRKVLKRDQEPLKSQYMKLLSVKAQHDSLIDSLHNKIQHILDEFNHSNKELLEEMRHSYLEASEKLKKLSLAQATKMDAYIAERSDEWHDGDAGFQYRYWTEEWEELAQVLEEEASRSFDFNVVFKKLPDLTLPDFQP